jgi:large subunit ribosomal protein L30
MATLKVTQVKSSIKRTDTQKRTLESLGLGRIGKSVQHQDSPSIHGMINKVKHLISVEEVK